MKLQAFLLWYNEMLFIPKQRKINQRKYLDNKSSVSIKQNQ